MIMLKRIFGNYNNTILWFQEYKSTFKSTDFIKMTKLGFQFPVVLVKDFISLTKSQKITSSVLVLVIIGVLFGFDNKWTCLETEVMCDVVKRSNGKLQMGRTKHQAKPAKKKPHIVID